MLQKKEKKVDILGYYLACEVAFFFLYVYSARDKKIVTSLAFWWLFLWLASTLLAPWGEDGETQKRYIRAWVGEVPLAGEMGRRF